MIKYLLMAANLLFVALVNAQPVSYECYIHTQQQGEWVSSAFRFTVEGSQATLSYTFRANPDQAPKHFDIPLAVLNNSKRSLVLGALTEGDEAHAPRYDVWVLDKNNMHLSAEVTHATDTRSGRLEQRSGSCIVED
jgi:hypothetical protein